MTEVQISNSIQVIDNFLPPEVFGQFSCQIMGSPSYRVLPFTANAMEAINKNFIEIQAQAMLFKRHADGIEYSDLYELNYQGIKSIKKLLKIKKLWQMRSICIMGQNKSYRGMYHADFPELNLIAKPKIAILYLNTNNGGTQFKDGEFVKSEANRCVIADGDALHAGVWQTDTKLRFVLNINYEEIN